MSKLSDKIRRVTRLQSGPRNGDPHDRRTSKTLEASMRKADFFVVLRRNFVLFERGFAAQDMDKTPVMFYLDVCLHRRFGKEVPWLILPG